MDFYVKMCVGIIMLLGVMYLIKLTGDHDKRRKTREELLFNQRVEKYEYVWSK